MNTINLSESRVDFTSAEGKTIYTDKTNFSRSKLKNTPPTPKDFKKSLKFISELDLSSNKKHYKSKSLVLCPPLKSGVEKIIKKYTTSRFTSARHEGEEGSTCGGTEESSRFNQRALINLMNNDLK